MAIIVTVSKELDFYIKPQSHQRSSVLRRPLWLLHGGWTGQTRTQGRDGGWGRDAGEAIS